MNRQLLREPEWIEADGLGGFASGTVCGARTRRYHALLLAATRPPIGRMVLVNGLDAWVETDQGSFALGSQVYDPGVMDPDGRRHLEDFSADPWPRWIWRLEDGTRLEQELFAVHGRPLTAIRWKLLAPTAMALLRARPFLSVRDYHRTHHENPAFRFDARAGGPAVQWHPYDGAPGVLAYFNGRYRHEPQWYRQFRYEHEIDRGLDGLEDLASPGELLWDLTRGDACLLLTTDDQPPLAEDQTQAPLTVFHALRGQEATRRARFASPLHRAADAYIVERGRGRSIIAGYPWFTDWGRDTFVALRGLCLATGRLDAARAILLEWSGTLSDGMIPNRFPDAGAVPEYNAVDASLWFVVAAGEYLAAAALAGCLGETDATRLRNAIQSILNAYRGGTRFGIRMDADALLAAGVPGLQLTWMDARVADCVITPRIGKPVEVQALWLNALRIAAAFEPAWMDLFERGLTSFRERFWDDERGGLVDVVDVDHVPGRLDRSIRPNQILAIGGLPLVLLDGPRARRLVETVERELWTPVGLRTLAPGEQDYCPSYEGNVAQRDAAYHQGTVWTWLAGPFVEAWVRVRAGEAVNGCNIRAEARARFLQPLLDRLQSAGLGHLSEIADGDAPHAPRGCPFQAWSLAELLRLDRVVLAEPPPEPDANILGTKRAGDLTDDLHRAMAG